jgi:arabinan endo-1,5-alpha-L-arabinosidase
MHRRRRVPAVLAAALTLTAVLGCSGTAARAEPPSAPTVRAAAAAAVVPAGNVAPVHDPALIVSKGVWYVFSTGLVHREQGGTVQIRRSLDRGRTWESVGTVWDAIPAWIDQHYAGGTLPDNLWAPEVVEHDGTFYLYYSASTFGKNDSITALATNTTLDPDDPDYRWVDRGPVVTSPQQALGGDADLAFNAIDAGIIEDKSGRPWMAIGSFWNGIFLVPLSWPSGKPVAGWQDRTVHLAERPGVEFDPVEAPYVVRHGKYYYLFTSWDFCCRGADSTYKIAVGRSTSLQGPYVDQDGRRLLDGGGTVLLETRGDHVGAGGQSVFKDTLAYHYYDGGNVAAPYLPTLGLEKIRWVDGWPQLR